MRRFYPSTFILPVWLAGGTFLGILFWIFSQQQWMKHVLPLLLCVAGLLFLIVFLVNFSLIADLVNAFEQQDTSVQNLTFSEKLKTIQQETSASRRHEMSTAQANTQAEIDALQSQINPHFLYNTLDSIRGQALIDNSPVIADMTEALSVIFRYSISRTGSLVTLREEFRCVEKYLIIQQFRFSGKFRYEKSVDEQLLSCLVPRLTLQPIIENAIFHGLETRPEGGVISLQMECCGQYLVVHVKDNGVGMTESQLLAINEKLRISPLIPVPPTTKHGSGIALGNVHRRIRLTFGEGYGLVVSSAPGEGTDVEVILPVLPAKDATV